MEVAALTAAVTLLKAYGASGAASRARTAHSSLSTTAPSVDNTSSHDTPTSSHDTPTPTHDTPTPAHDTPTPAAVVAAVEALAKLLTLSSSAAKALHSADLARANSLCLAYESALSAAGSSAASLAFLGPVSERVARTSARTLQSVSESLTRICCVFDGFRYGEVFAVLGTLGEADVCARVVAAYEGAVLKERRCRAGSGYFRAVAGIVLSFYRAVEWHRGEGGMGEARKRFCRVVMVQTARVLAEITDGGGCGEVQRLLEIYRCVWQLDMLLEAVASGAGTSLASIDADEEDEVRRRSFNSEASTDSLDRVPELANADRLVLRKYGSSGGVKGKSVRRMRIALDAAGGGCLLRALKDFVVAEWRRLAKVVRGEALELIRSAAWSRLRFTALQLAAIERSMRESGVGDAAFSPGDFTPDMALAVLKSGSVERLAWVSTSKNGGRDSDDAGSGTTASATLPTEVMESRDMGELTFSAVSLSLYLNTIAYHLCVGRQIQEVRTICCHDAIQLYLLLLRVVLRLLPSPPEETVLAQVLSTSASCQEESYMRFKSYLAPGVAQHANPLFDDNTGDDGEGEIVLPSFSLNFGGFDRLVPTCVCLESAWSLKEELGPSMIGLCGDDILSSRSADAAFVMCAHFRKATYLYLARTLFCSRLRNSCVKDPAWGASLLFSSEVLPTGELSYVRQFFVITKRFAEIRQHLPPESADRLGVALCHVSMSTLLDAFSELNDCTISTRLQMFYDVRTVEQELETLTGLHPLPGVARLKAYVQAWFLEADELDGWIEDNRRALALSESHVLALKQVNLDTSPSEAVLSFFGNSSGLLGSLKSLVSLNGEREQDDDVPTFVISDEMEG